MAEKKQRISIKVTDLESGHEQISAEYITIPGLGFCSCSTTSYSYVPPTGPVFTAANRE
jgi:hypothetical protein